MQRQIFNMKNKKKNITKTKRSEILMILYKNYKKVIKMSFDALYCWQ